MTKTAGRTVCNTDFETIENPGYNRDSMATNMGPTQRRIVGFIKTNNNVSNCQQHKQTNFEAIENTLEEIHHLNIDLYLEFKDNEVIMVHPQVTDSMKRKKRNQSKIKKEKNN